MSNSPAKKPQPVDNPAFKQAVTLLNSGRPEEAAQIFKNQLKADPNNAGAWLNLGAVLRQMGNFDASLACSSRALEISPGNPSFLMNHGNCLVDLDRRDEALQALAASAEQRPNDFFARKNYAIALREFDRHEEALLHFNAACVMKPNDIQVRWERAVTYLHLARFREGWEAFEIRWKLGKLKNRTHNIPRWQGEDLRGKTIVIYEEQGFGDTILCSRYIPMVKARGGRVILECKKPLHRLFQSIHGLDKLIEPDQLNEPCDYQVPMMSLPGIFGTDLNSIPPIADLHVPAALPAEAARLLEMGKNRLKVGIVWSGSTTFARNRKRAVPITRFLPLAEIPGVQLYSLQKGPCEKDLTEHGAEGVILELGPHLNDFADTAAVLKELDLVIMTDSSVAHLASSLGVPVWNMLCYHPYWLYLSKREDSPWYPSMRFFRQPEPGDWDGVFKKVMAELEKTAAKKTVPARRSRSGTA